MRFLMLGPLEGRDEGRAVAVGAGRQRALLADLLVHAREVVSTDRLIRDVWGEEPPPSAAHLVQVYVSRLRKRLHRRAHDPVLLTQAPGYLLAIAPEHTDVHEFDRLVAGGREAFAQDRSA